MAVSQIFCLARAKTPLRSLSERGGVLNYSDLVNPFCFTGRWSLFFSLFLRSFISRGGRSISILRGFRRISGFHCSDLILSVRFSGCIQHGSQLCVHFLRFHSKGEHNRAVDILAAAKRASEYKRRGFGWRPVAESGGNRVAGFFKRSDYILLQLIKVCRDQGKDDIGTLVPFISPSRKAFSASAISFMPSIWIASAPAP